MNHDCVLSRAKWVALPEVLAVCFGTLHAPIVVERSDTDARFMPASCRVRGD
jgi:hypothetical protein